MDNSLDILIKLGVVNAKDVEALNDLVEEQKKLVEDADKSWQTYNVTQKDVEAALGRTKKALQENVEDHKKVHESTRASNIQMRMLAHILGEGIPGAAEIMHGSMDLVESGMESAIGKTFLLIGTLEILRQIWKEMNALDQIKLDFTSSEKSAAAVKESLEKARIALVLFNEELTSKAHQEISAEESEKRQLANWKNLEEAVKSYNEAAKGLATAKIEEQEKTGVISHQQALQAKYQLDVQYEAAKLKLEHDSFQEEETMDAQRLAKEQAKLDALTKHGGEMDQAYSKAKDSEAVLAKHNADKAAAQERITQAQKTLDELSKSHGTFIKGEITDENAQQLELYYAKYFGDPTGKSHSEMFGAFQGNSMSAGNQAKAVMDPGLIAFLTHTIGNQQGEAGFAQYDAAQQQIKDAKKELGILEKSDFDVQVDAERNKKLLEETETNVSKLTESVKSLQESLPQKQADDAAKFKNSTTLANLGLRTEHVKMFGTDTGDTFTGGATGPVAAPDAGQQSTAVARVAGYTEPGYGSGNTISDLMTKLHYTQAEMDASLGYLADHLDKQRAAWEGLRDKINGIGVG